MNPRLPYSARQLQTEVSEIDEDATFEPASIDGLGTYRAMLIYTGDVLGIAEAISRVRDIDRRIDYVECNDELVRVNFPPDRIVESRARFGIGDIYKALTETAEPEPQSTETDWTVNEKPVHDVEPKKKPAPRKRAAKKS